MLKTIKNRVWLGFAILLLVISALSWVIFKPLSSFSVPLVGKQIIKPYPAQAYQAKLVKLPADDAPHDLQTEWWYYNGHLETDDGQYFSFHYVVFLDNGLLTLTAVHVSVTDHQTGRRYTDQLRTGGNPSRGSVNGFNFNFADWEMSGSGGYDVLKIKSTDFMFDLNLTEGKPATFHGGTGLLDFGKAGTSYYYSRTRMPTKGIIKVNGQQFAVSGVSWFDHQWGDFRATQLSWSWFSLQLDDGSDIMLYELLDAEGKTLLNSGTLIKNDAIINLTDSDFSTESLSTWTSQDTLIIYPMGWRVSILRHAIDVTLIPEHQESEFDGRMTTHNAYWEGAVNVRGARPGKGFVELGGYSLKPKH